MKDIGYIISNNFEKYISDIKHSISETKKLKQLGFNKTSDGKLSLTVGKMKITIYERVNRFFIQADKTMSDGDPECNYVTVSRYCICLTNHYCVDKFIKIRQKSLKLIQKYIKVRSGL